MYLLWALCVICFCVMHLPFVVSWIMYDLLWWLWLPVPTIVPWVHEPPSSHWTATADPMGIYANTGEASLLFFCCLSTSLLRWSSSQSCMIGLQSKTGMMPWTCLLNIIVARLSKPWPNGIVCICSRAIFMSLAKLGHFLNVHFMNLVQASTCLLLWWWYANDNACSMLNVLQNCGTYPKWNLCQHVTLFFGVYHLLLVSQWWKLVEVSVEESHTRRNGIITIVKKQKLGSPYSWMLTGSIIKKGWLKYELYYQPV